MPVIGWIFIKSKGGRIPAEISIQIQPPEMSCMRNRMNTQMLITNSLDFLTMNYFISSTAATDGQMLKHKALVDDKVLLISTAIGPDERRDKTIRKKYLECK
jgi:hypothetical protein